MSEGGGTGVFCHCRRRTDGRPGRVGCAKKEEGPVDNKQIRSEGRAKCYPRRFRPRPAALCLCAAKCAKPEVTPTALEVIDREFAGTTLFY